MNGVCALHDVVVGHDIAVISDYDAGTGSGILLLGFACSIGYCGVANVDADYACHAVLDYAGCVCAVLAVICYVELIGGVFAVFRLAHAVIRSFGVGLIDVVLIGFFNYHVGGIKRGSLLLIDSSAEICACGAKYERYRQQAYYKLRGSYALLFLFIGGVVAVRGIISLTVLVAVVAVPVVFHIFKRTPFVFSKMNCNI